TGRRGQHVEAQAVRSMEFLRITMHKCNAALAEHLVEGGRQKRSMDQRKVFRERRDHRLQVQTGVLTLPERQVEAMNGNALGLEQRGKLPDAFLVGADAPTDRQRSGIDPDTIAALDLAGR